MSLINKLDHLQQLNQEVKNSFDDFYTAARMSQNDFQFQLSKLSVINSEQVMNNQDLQSLTKTKSSPITSDEGLQRVSAEFNFLNKNFFECLESHSKSVRRSLLQINNVVDQHNLQLMSCNSLAKKIQDKCSKSDTL